MEFNNTEQPDIADDLLHFFVCSEHCLQCKLHTQQSKSLVLNLTLTGKPSKKSAVSYPTLVMSLSKLLAYQSQLVKLLTDMFDLNTITLKGVNRHHQKYLDNLLQRSLIRQSLLCQLRNADKLGEIVQSFLNMLLVYSYFI